MYKGVLFLGALLSLCAQASVVSGAVVGLFPTTVSGNTTGQLDDAIIGPPNAIFLGLGNASVTYDFGESRVIDSSGGDFNVYEQPGGLIEFADLAVAVSLNGSDFFDVTATAAAGIELIGAEAHLPDYIRSFDLSGTGLTMARFLRLTGTASTPAGGSSGFDLDAVGAINFTTVPTPAAFAPGLLLLGAVIIRRRRGAHHAAPGKASNRL